MVVKVKEIALDSPCARVHTQILQGGGLMDSSHRRRNRLEKCASKTKKCAPKTLRCSVVALKHKNKTHFL